MTLFYEVRNLNGITSRPANQITCVLKDTHPNTQDYSFTRFKNPFDPLWIYFPAFPVCSYSSVKLNSSQSE